MHAVQLVTPCPSQAWALQCNVCITATAFCSLHEASRLVIQMITLQPLQDEHCQARVLGVQATAPAAALLLFTRSQGSAVLPRSTAVPCMVWCAVCGQTAALHCRAVRTPCMASGPLQLGPLLHDSRAARPPLLPPRSARKCESGPGTDILAVF